MERPASYDAWKSAATAADERSGAEAWKLEDRTRRYDYQVIRKRYDELLEVRASGSGQRLLYYLNEGVHGNMGGMGSPALYTRCRFGTKKLVTDYVREVKAALLQLEELRNRRIDADEKLEFYRRASLCFGRSALMLSGAGSLGPFHIGVVKALAEQKLLPAVISGASAGAIVTAIVGSHKPDLLAERLSSEKLPIAELLADSNGVSGTQRRVDVERVKALIEATIPDVTFGEAFAESGVSINIPVAPAERQQRSRLLNAITSPNVFLRDAVLASCAIPGVFPSVTLMAKNATGRRQPYVPSRTWVDGSITDDLPARRLARMYGVNHFISSQANPLVLWALQDPAGATSLTSRVLGIYQSAGRELLRAIYPIAMSAVHDYSRLSMATRMSFSFLTQEYTADVTILPQRRYSPWMLLAELSREDVDELILEGERATWPKIEMIRNCTEISRCIDEILGRMEEQRVYQHDRSA